MEQHEMIEIVERHLKAEGAGDVEGAVAVYTDDIEHDAVGFPGSPRIGREAAREFYGFLAANFRTEDEQPLHRYFSAAARSAHRARRDCLASAATAHKRRTRRQ